MKAIEVTGLTRSFDDILAVDRVSFSVEKGELFGLLGPNGAGKTTMINMLSTLLKPTSGTGLVAGFDILLNKNDVRESIGIVFQELALDVKLTGKENLEFHSMMYNMPKTLRRERIKEVLKLVELTFKADLLVETYSGGMKRRLEIARGLIHRPHVLFLDEPTLGLDAQTRRHIWDYIKKLNRENKVTIILTTHYMEEADFLCDRVAIIDHGKIVACDSPSRLKDTLGGDVVTVEIKNDPTALLAHLKGLEWIKTLNQHEECLSMTMDKGERRIPELIQAAQKHQVDVACVHLHRPSLEDVFLNFTGRTMRDEEASQSERNRTMMRAHLRRRR